MKKIVFIFSLLCFLAMTNVNAQIERPTKKIQGKSKVINKSAIEKETPSNRVYAKKTPESVIKKEKMQKRTYYRMDAKTKRDAAIAASRDLDIVSRKVGSEIIYYRKGYDQAGNEILTRVNYEKKTGKFVIPKRDNKSSGDGIEEIRAPKNSKNNRWR